MYGPPSNDYVLCILHHLSQFEICIWSICVGMAFGKAMFLMSIFVGKDPTQNGYRVLCCKAEQLLTTIVRHLMTIIILFLPMNADSFSIYLCIQINLHYFLVEKRAISYHFVQFFLIFFFFSLVYIYQSNIMTFPLNPYGTYSVIY